MPSTPRPTFHNWLRTHRDAPVPIRDIAPDILADQHWPEDPGSLGRYENRLNEVGADDWAITALRAAWAAYTTDVGDPRSPAVAVTAERLAALTVERSLLSDEGWGRPARVWPAAWKVERVEAVASLIASLDHVRAAARWIRSCEWMPRATRDDPSSYGLKHVMEHEVGVYVTNGAFIAAALLIGVPVLLEGLNPSVGIQLYPADYARARYRRGSPSQAEWSVKEWARDDPGRGVGVTAAEYAAGEDPIQMFDDDEPTHG